jgi:hypothetical protein
VLGASVWRHMLGVDRATVIEVIDFDEESEPSALHQASLRALRDPCAGL